VSSAAVKLGKPKGNEFRKRGGVCNLEIVGKRGEGGTTSPRIEKGFKQGKEEMTPHEVWWGRAKEGGL